MAEVQTERPQTRASRVLVTILACAAALAARRVVAPGVDLGLIRNQLGDFSIGQFSIVTMGIQPVISAYLMVELFAAAMGRFRSMRHDPLGRQKLTRATAVLTLLFCFFQSFGVKMYVQALSALDAPAYVFMPTLIAGSFMLWALANAITKYGFGNGIIVLASLTAVADVLSGISSSRGPIGLPASDTPVYLRVLGFVAAGAIVAAATVVVFARTRTRSSDKRVPNALPVPSSGLNPLNGVAALASLLPLLKLASFGSYQPLVWYAFDSMLIILLTPALAWVFNQPERVAGVLHSCGQGSSDRVVRRAREMLLASLPLTIAFVLTVRAAELLGIHLEGGGQFYVFAWIVAAVLDAGDQWRIADGQLRVAWQEHRPYALSAAERLLDKEGIAWRIRGLRQRALVPFGGPFIPIEILVRDDELERARSLLSEALKGERIVAAPPEAPRLTDLARESLLKACRTKRVFAMWAFAGCIVALAAVALSYSTAQARPAGISSEKRRRELLVCLVDDSQDRFDAVAAALPAHAERRREVAPVGPGRSQSLHFIHFGIDREADLDKKRDEAEAWLRALGKPEGARYAIGDVFESDDEGTMKLSGFRTWVLREDVVLTGDDIKDAVVVAQGDVYVALTLFPEAAYKFEVFTRNNTKRRLAIVVRGRVLSAPLIETAIAGGHIQVSMGQQPNAQQLEDAHRLARALKGHR